VYIRKKDLLSATQVRLERFPGASDPPPAYPDDDVVNDGTATLSRTEKRRLGYGYALTFNLPVSVADASNAVVPVEAYSLSRAAAAASAKNKDWSRSKSATLPMTFRSAGRKASKSKAAKINNWINAAGKKGAAEVDLKIKESTGFSLRGVLEVVFGMIVAIGCGVWWLIDDDEIQDPNSRKGK
jgi:hypothetical protein